MKVVNVTVEGMHATEFQSYPLSRINYLNGPNGTGKSTVLQALQLALLGYIPGTDKKKSAIFQHANSSTMSVSVDLDDNGVPVKVKRLWSQSRSGIVSTVNITPVGYNISNILFDIELPVFNFNEFTGMTANKLKDWFIQFLPDTCVEIDWDSELSSSAEGADSTLMKNVISDIQRCGYAGVDQVRWANDYFKKELSYKKQELERLTGTVQSLIYYEDADEDDLDEVSQELRNLTEKKQVADKYAALKLSNDRIRYLLNTSYRDCIADSVEDDTVFKSLCEERDKLRSELSDLEKTLKHYNSILVESSQKISQMKSEVAFRERTISGKGICPYTSTYCESISSVIDRLRTEIENYQKQISEQQQKCDNLRKNIHVLESQISDRSNRIRACAVKLSNLTQLYASRDKTASQLVEVPDTLDETDYDTLIGNLQERRSKILANQKYQKLVSSVSENRLKLEQEINWYKQWVTLTGVNGLQSTASSTDPFLGLKTAMTEMLNKMFSDKCSVEFLHETKSNGFDFGIKRGDEFISYNMLSSGERCLYAVALLSGIVRLSRCPLKIILIDDMLDHLDDTHIDRLFCALDSEDEIQYVFAGVKSISADKLNYSCVIPFTK